MKQLILASTAALLLATGLAHAQVSSSSSSTTTTADPGMAPPPADMAPPPAGTLSTTREMHAQDANGNSVDRSSSTYRDANGVARDSKTSRTTVTQPPPMQSTTSTDSSTSTSTSTPQ